MSWDPKHPDWNDIEGAAAYIRGEREVSENEPVAWMTGPGIAAYRGKADCKNVMCTRVPEEPGCYGWHCALCDEPTDAQGGHRCLLEGREK